MEFASGLQSICESITNSLKVALLYFKLDQEETIES